MWEKQENTESIAQFVGWCIFICLVPICCRCFHTYFSRKYQPGAFLWRSTSTVTVTSVSSSSSWPWPRSGPRFRSGPRASHFLQPNEVNRMCRVLPFTHTQNLTSEHDGVFHNDDYILHKPKPCATVKIAVSWTVGPVEVTVCFKLVAFIFICDFKPLVCRTLPIPFFSSGHVYKYILGSEAQHCKPRHPE